MWCFICYWKNYDHLWTDLTDQKIYRDLSKPVGWDDKNLVICLIGYYRRYLIFLWLLSALNPDRLASLIERFNELDGFPEEEKFLYGSHYSSPGVVLHYMVRQEPFTSMHIALQSGRFDCPDRLFFDVAGCWRSCLSSTSDVKVRCWESRLNFRWILRGITNILDSSDSNRSLPQSFLRALKYSSTQMHFHWEKLKIKHL